MNFIIQLLQLFFQLLESLLKGLFEFIDFAVKAIPRKNHAYSASFAPERMILGKTEKGFCLTGNRNLSVKNSYQNALVIGPTGTGKSSILLLPSLYSMSGSFVINDPSGELHMKSSGFLEQKGYAVKILHFANPAVSSGYNPLQRANSSSEIQKIASMLVENALGGNKAKDPFWTTQATALLAMLISILKTQDMQYQNLYNVRQLLNQLGGSPEKVDKLFSNFASESLFSEYRSFLSSDEKVVSGVTATCKASLQIFSDESVAMVTSFDSIDFNDFRRSPTALFIQNSVADQRYYAVLTSIFFEQFFSFVLSRFPKEGEQDIFFLIDECSSLKLPTLSLAVANIRKTRGGALLIFQSEFQMVHHYGKAEAEAIKSNCFAKLYLTGQGIETAKELEQTLGKFEYEDKEKKKHVRSLLTADEIRMLKVTEALLICGHHPPIQVKLKPYYENGRFRNNDRIHPPARPSEIPFKDLPVLDLSSLESTV